MRYHKLGTLNGNDVVLSRIMFERTRIYATLALLGERNTYLNLTISNGEVGEQGMATWERPTKARRDLSNWWPEHIVDIQQAIVLEAYDQMDEALEAYQRASSDYGAATERYNNIAGTALRPHGG